MKRWRVTAVLTTVGVAIGGGTMLRGAVAVRATVAPPSQRSAVLEAFYTPPVLVRAGERVQVPVDVVCATEAGRPCPTTVTLGARAGAARWEQATAPGVKGMRFDLTAPAARSVATAGHGRVSFFLRAADAAGRTEALGSTSSPLAFYVTRDLPVVRVPAVPFGQVQRPQTVLSLRWGSGPARAGLEPGLESATVGPSSFDVDAAGRIYLIDSLQDRVAVFRDGKLVRQIPVAVSARADVAAGDGGRTFIADADHGAVEVRAFDSAGRPIGTSSVGPGLSWHIRAIGSRAFVNVLPLDAWVPAGGGAAVVGMPTASGARLLRLGTERSVRLGSVHGDRVTGAVEIVSKVRFGEVALAEPDGARGYVVVVHTWRAAPTPADQYQVIRVAGRRVLGTFAVANTSFAETPPLSRFRLGKDGRLYQMTSSPSGVKIVRFELGRSGR